MVVNVAGDVVPKVHFGGGGATVWVGITSQSKTDLVNVDGSIITAILTLRKS